ncbi:MAG: GNAT family N-acetyltransferase [Muribaculaceae bacterium]|nr:GNAT family N-acetyltransferase [Muribaculaceae bacterium]
MEIRNLENVDFDTLLFRAFSRAFADYAINFDKEEVRSMLVRRGFNPALSFAAYDGDEIVAFTFNGIGTYNDTLTAYDTGTGTVKDYRGQGIAADIFTYSLPALRVAGVRQYLLEVLQDNGKAISVYRRLGFETTREFYCFHRSIESIRLADNSAKCTVAPVAVDTVRTMQSACDFIPSWQNSIESIERGQGQLTCLAAMIGDAKVGYCVFDSATGDLSQIAVNAQFRRQGIGSRLLHEAAMRMVTGSIKVLNIPPDATSVIAFLCARNIPVATKQYEMILPL